MAQRTEIDYIIDLHRGSQRQGPGSEKATLQALQLMELPDDRTLKLADMGCGSGGQTLTLAQNINAQITAVDFSPEFLTELNKKSQKLGFGKKIITLAQSMDNLPFHDTNEEFDIIWSEGAIYNIGFENGVKQWKDYLREGGYLAVSEITWISNTRPKEIEEFWTREYPEIDTASNKIKIIENNGYSLVGYFFLSQDAWIENYYKPMEARFEAFLKRNNHVELAKKMVKESKAEMELYQKYKDHYSYGFYIAKKDTEHDKKLQKKF